ncbi:uncharacterized protein LOC143853490 [Tasmannia lanceolata]|uniref:uncharacterized protein LOC143853490 n=1 Tax=Tasmannia lanceolata TaxID=3420 RepID=UPI004062BCE1
MDKECNRDGEEKDKRSRDIPILLLHWFLGLMTSKRVHRSTKVMAKECKRVTINGGEEDRRWIDLPIEIGVLIAARLHLIEFHAFRSVCKQWRLAASLNSSTLPQSFKPWILFYGEDKCFLYNIESPKSYFMQIPELIGADCIASEQGWLLVHLDERLFFFNIFSRAKINLPQIPDFKFSNHVATFSAPPTSKDCIVFVNRISPTTETIEINMCRHGSRDWETHTHISDPGFKTITCVKYRAKDELLDYYDFKLMTMDTYNSCDKSSSLYNLGNGPPPEQAGFLISWEEDYLERVISANIDIRKWLDQFGEEKNISIISISLCGTSVQEPRGDIFYPHEGSDYVHGQLKAVLVEPRFIDLTQNHSWLV